MKKNKIVQVALAAMMTPLSGVLVQAQNETSDVKPVVTTDAVFEDDMNLEKQDTRFDIPVPIEDIQRLLIEGEIVEITNDTILIKGNEQYPSVYLAMNDDTLILDATTGNPTALNDVRKGTKLYAYTSPAMTRSAIPSTQAKVLLVNVKDDELTPHYIEVESVEKSEKDVRLFVDTKDMYITINHDTPYFAYRTKNTVKSSEIMPKQRLIVWYDIVLMSYPGQTTALKAMLLPDAKNGWAFENENWVYYQNDEKLMNHWVAAAGERWYYLDDQGSMAANKEINGNSFNANGIWIRK